MTAFPYRGQWKSSSRMCTSPACSTRRWCFTGLPFPGPGRKDAYHDMSFWLYTPQLRCKSLLVALFFETLTVRRFLPFESPLIGRNATLLQPLGDLRALGRRWAVRAGKEVLQNIDQPTFESVQTCEMLTLYWFSAGESQRNTMFSGMALSLYRLLGQLLIRTPSARDCV